MHDAYQCAGAPVATPAVQVNYMTLGNAAHKGAGQLQHTIVIRYATVANGKVSESELLLRYYLVARQARQKVLLFNDRTNILKIWT